MIHMLTKIVSTKKTYGHKSKEGAKTRKTAAAANLLKRLNPLLAATKEVVTEIAEEVIKDTPKRRILPIDHEPKAWGHDGNTQSAIIYKAEGQFKDIPKMILKADQAAVLLETFDSIDIKEAKRGVEAEDTASAKAFRLQHGISLTADQMDELSNIQCSHAITYYSTQVTFILYSDQEFQGARLDKERNLYISASSCKAWITLQPVKSSIVEKLILAVTSGDVAKSKSISIGEFRAQEDQNGNFRFISVIPRDGQGYLRKSSFVEEKDWKTILD